MLAEKVSIYEAVALHELTTTITPEMEDDRLAMLGTIRNTRSRLLYNGLHNAIAHFPRAAETLLGTERQAPEADYVGMGGECTVIQYEGESDVTKIIHRSATLDNARQEQLVEQQQEEYLAVQRKLGRFILPQSWQIGDHPLLAGKTAVTISQPHRQLIDLGLFFKQPIKQIKRLKELSDLLPDVVPQLSDFIDGSRALYQEEGLLPDVHSPGNLAIDDQGSLLLIDLHGPDCSWPDRQRRVNQHLDVLEQAIQAAV